MDQAGKKRMRRALERARDGADGTDWLFGTAESEGAETARADDIVSREQTALHKAAMNGHAGVVRLLLKAGANTEIRDTWEKTPLYWAVANGHLGVIRLLVEHGADINVFDDSHHSVLQQAITEKNFAAIDLLLELGADINACANTEAGPGPSALHTAARVTSVDMVAHLLLAGADIDSVDHIGQTPEKEARTPGIAHLLKTVRELGIVAIPEAVVRARGMDEALSADELAAFKAGVDRRQHLILRQEATRWLETAQASKATEKPAAAEH